MTKPEVILEDDPSLEELEAAGDMYDALASGTFYEREAEALKWLRERSKHVRPHEI